MKNFEMSFRCIAALTLLGFAAPADASKLHMVINGKSVHIRSAYDWNENNYGAGIEYEFNSNSRWIRTTMVNAFLDSDENMSYMLGGGLHRRLLMTDRLAGLYLDVGINAFVMTRQDVNQNRPFPAALPSMTIGNRYGGINISFVPKKALHDIGHANRLDPDIGGVFFIQAKIRLDGLFGD